MQMTEQRYFRLEDLYRLAIPSDPQFAPDGETVAFVVTRPRRDSDDYESSIWLYRADGGGAMQLTHGPSDAAPRWSPDARSVAFVSRRETDGQVPRLHTIAIGSGKAEPLCGHPCVSPPVWSPGGDRIAFAAIVGQEEDTATAPHRPVVVDRLGYKADGQGLIGGRSPQLLVVPATGGHAKQLTFGDQSAGSPIWSPDGRQIAFAGSCSSDGDLTGATQVFVMSATGGLPRALTPAGAQLIPLDWSTDGSVLLVAGLFELAVGHTRLYTVPPTGGKLAPVAPAFDRNVLLGEAGYPGGQPCFAGSGSTVMFCASDRGCAHIFAAAAGTVPRKVIGGTDRVVSGMSAGNDRMAFVAATADSPGEVYVTALDGSHERRLTSLFASGLPGVRLHRLKARTFRSSDGGSVHGWLIRRDDVSGAMPLLLDIHSGPHNSWGPAFNGWHLYHQTMAAAGWTILCVNPRGSDGYGERFYRAAVSRWGVADEDDLLCAVDELVAEGLADPARLVVTGYSYGGYMSAWLTTRTDRFAAAVVGGGMVNLASAAGTSDDHITFGRELGGWLHESPDQYVALSPITHVAKVTAATLILHGECDHRIPVGQGEEWFAALRSLRRRVKLVRYPGASHLFVLTGPPSQRLDYCWRVADWADRHTGPPRSRRGLNRER
jgi:dipeptidyl aminopeptidase/acylaminoacyl peptidase